MQTLINIQMTHQELGEIIHCLLYTYHNKETTAIHKHDIASLQGKMSTIYINTKTTHNDSGNRNTQER